jgi:hypothetical protein
MVHWLHTQAAPPDVVARRSGPVNRGRDETE